MVQEELKTLTRYIELINKLSEVAREKTIWYHSVPMRNYLKYKPRD